MKESLRPEKYAEVVAADGEFPGNYMVTSDGCLGVARLQFGNIVLMPQNAAGSGDNSFQVVISLLIYGCSTVSKLMHSFISEHMAVWNSLLKNKLPYAAMTGRTVWSELFLTFISILSEM